MELEQKLQEIQAIAELALKGIRDEEIAKQFNTTPFRILSIRRSLGIRYRTFTPITETWRKVSLTNNHHYVKFPLPKHLIEELGHDSTKRLEITAKISGTKLLLEFREQK